MAPASPERVHARGSSGEKLCRISLAAEFGDETATQAKATSNACDDAFWFGDPMPSGIGKDRIEGFGERDFASVHHLKLQTRISLSRLANHVGGKINASANGAHTGDFRG
jgi:hypothetical protein